jgi:hypothetical protein
MQYCNTSAATSLSDAILPSRWAGGIRVWVIENVGGGAESFIDKAVSGGYFIIKYYQQAVIYNEF